MQMRLPVFGLVCAALWAAGMPGWAAAPAAPMLGANGGGVQSSKVGIFPVSGTKDVCVDAPLRITFSTPPTIGEGNIQIIDASDNSVVETIDVGNPTRYKTLGGFKNFVYKPVLITGNEAAIYLSAPLAYGKSYYVKADAGAFKDQPFEAIAKMGDKAWQFSTKAAAPSPADVAGTKRITISADGSADFCTVQGAIDSVAAGNTTPTTLFIKNGTYQEIIAFTGKNFLTFLGEDRKKTIIAYAVNDKFSTTPPRGATAPTGGNGGIYRRGVLMAQRVTDLTLANMTIRNTTPKGGTQAECIILNGGRDGHTVVTNVDLYSYQDTLQINGQAYVSNCYIEGDVDFMWGNGPTFFENVEAKALSSGRYFTMIRNPATNHGFIYKDCIFDGADGITGNVLARIAPAQWPASEVGLINCVVTDAVGPVAWQAPGEAPNLRFWEYNSHGPDGKPVDVSKRLPASKQLTMPQDAEAIKNYSDPVWVLGGNWNPKDAPIFKK